MTLRMTTLIGISYFNNVTGEHQYTTPSPFKVGILADDMGLGKTVTSISLILSDLPRKTVEISPATLESKAHKDALTSLLIVPVSRMCATDHHGDPITKMKIHNQYYRCGRARLRGSMTSLLCRQPLILFIATSSMTLSNIVCTMVDTGTEIVLTLEI
jgi:DNA repair protein RAD5